MLINDVVFLFLTPLGGMIKMFQFNSLSKLINVNFAIAVLALGASVVEAQGAGQGALEEITVTATRRGETSIQDIPIAVTALDPDTLQQQGLETLSDITRNVPGLIINNNGGGQNEIVVRGITTTGILNPTDTARNALVANYLDDVPMSVLGLTPDIRVFDLERIEFLRGPQGTLFGAGAMAGLVRFISKKPNLEEFEGSIQASASDTEGGSMGWSVRGMVNVPLNDNFGLRVTAYEGSDGGWIDNTATGNDNANELDITQFRTMLRYTNHDNLTIDFSHLYADVSTPLNNKVYRETGDTTLFSPNREGVEDEIHILNLVGELELNFGTLYSSTSYMDRDNIAFSDDFFFGLSFFGLSTDNESHRDQDFESFTQEVRFAFNEIGPFNLQLGVFYEDQERTYRQSNVWVGTEAFINAVIAPGLGDVVAFWNGNVADEVFNSLTNTDTRQVAFFGEGTWRPIESIELTAGFRYFDWKQTYDLYAASFAGSLAPGVPAVLPPTTSKEDGVNPRFAAAYHFENNVMVYAEAAKGFRYGGVNQLVPVAFCGLQLSVLGLTAAPPDFGPDHLWTYTIGEKGSFFDNRVIFNIAAFLTDWDNIQTNRNLDDPFPCGYYYTETAGRVRSQGVEIESQWQATDSLSFSLGATYTDAEAREDLPNVNAIDGDTVPFFPEWLFNFGAVYETSFANGGLTIAADYSYRGDAGTRFNVADPQYRIIPSSDVVNASVTWRYEDYEISLFVRNLTDEYIVTAREPSRLVAEPGDATTIARPRSYGITLSRDF